MSDLTTATEAVKANPILDLVVRQEPAIAKQLAGTINSGAFVRAALTTLRGNDALMRCSPESVLGSIMLAAQLRLEIGGPLGHFYLTPRKAVCVPIIGYRGYIALAYRSGLVEKIETQLVREGDMFERGADSDRGLYYRWAPWSDDGAEQRPWTGVITNVKITGAGVIWSYLSHDDVLARRGPTVMGPWATHEEAMARKTGVRDIAPYMPMSTDLGRALAADEQRVEYREGVDELTVTRIDEPEVPGDAPA